MDRLLRDFMGDMGEDERLEGVASPRMDLVETKEGYQLEAELPGIEPKDVKVSVTGNMLAIEAERTEERSRGEREGTRYLRERQIRRYQRTVGLPEEIDGSRITASMRNGVLSITLPRSEKARPRQIEVRSHDRAIEGAAVPRVEGEKKGEKRKDAAA